MFNVTVLKMKDIKKYVILFIITFFSIILICRYFPKKNEEENKIAKIIPKSNMIGCIEQEASVVKKIGKDEEKGKKEEQNNKTKVLQKILETQVSTINSINNQQEDIKDVGTEPIQEEQQIAQDNNEPRQEETQNMEEAKVRSSN